MCCLSSTFPLAPFPFYGDLTTQAVNGGAFRGREKWALAGGAGQAGTVFSVARAAITHLAVTVAAAAPLLR